MRDKDNMKDLNYFNPMKLREKYSAKSVSTGNNYSSFWLDNDWDNTTSFFDEEVEKPGVDLIALASYRRAIANFVNIVTSKNIPVTFTSQGDSFTDGKKVTISSKLDDKLFDSTVGLALHEGSHILLSDFDFVKNLEFNIPKEYIDRGFTKGYSEFDVKVHIKNLLNFVEDRRIDYHVFSNAPGYKGYYHSMYDKYFRAKVVDKGLLSDEYTDENLDSYMFRIVNITNSNTRLDKLNGLREIWKVLDLKNISRLGSTEEAFNTALDVYNVVLNNLPDGVEKTNKDTGEVSYERADGSGDSNHSDSNMDSGSEESREITEEEFNDLLDSIESGETKEGEGNVSVDVGGSEDSDSDGTVGGGTTDGKTSDDKTSDGGTEVGKKKSEITLSDSQKKSLENAIKKQKKFMDEEIQKKKLSKKDKSAIDAIDASGMSYKEVGKDLKDRYDGKSKKTKCILVKNLNKSLVESGTVSMLSSHSYYRSDTEEAIEEGLRLGTILGRKLSVRTESRDTKYTRKDTGRIDKRLIAELGFGNSNVFSQTFVDTYPDAFLHISVDASGSMSGGKWERTMKSVVAMTKAIDMIEGVDVVVSFRSTQDSGGGRSRSSREHPIMLIAYDSRKDSLVKVKTLWKHIRCNGTTPEGLCYEAIMDEMVEGMKDRESYFLNFSDGMPMFSNDDVNYYHGEALDHTRKMVKEIRNRGIKVMSYFIGDSYDGERNMGDFKRMYGKDSEFVDVTSVTAVSRTMNKKFLEKN
jgi:hypothetical protein